MPLKNRFSQVIGLSSLDVYLETPVGDNSYFDIEGLPEILGYGKHAFRLSFKDPVNKPLLKNNSPIIFEFVDSRGEVIFSELSDIPDLSGAATAYIWIKKDPLRMANEIADGPITLYVVGELDGVPDAYKGRSNIRSSYTFNVRKNFPNTSPIVFYNIDGLKASSSFSESLELDNGSSTYYRGYINVSASHLQTQGGKVAFGELSFRETGSQTEEFTVLSEYKLIGSTTVFETSDTGSEGINPISHIYKTPIPKDIRRDTPVVFKVRFLDENKNPAMFYDANNINKNVEVTSSILVINGSPTIIEKEDNLLKGSMYTGNAVGKGFEQSGKSSAFLKTVDYTGFKSASLGIGSGGVMFWSGSVLSQSGDNYDGVGLELFAHTESYFKFRSDPSDLDIRTKAFFVGSETTQFISASGGNIEISSSGFHLSPNGNLTASNFLFAGGGTIGSDVTILADLTANQIRTPAEINGVASTEANASSSITSQGFASFKSASIGGFKVNETEIKSTNEKIIFKSSGQISASSMLLSSGSFVVDPDNLTRFGGDDFASFFMANDTGVRIQTSNFNLNTQRFVISSSDVGVMAVGSTPPLSHESGTGFFVDGDGNFLVGKAAGPRIQFDGFQTIISSSTFLLGGGEQFVSGSNGNIEISSSNFHLQPDGDVVMAGTVTATAGFIGGFTIDADEVKSGTDIALNSNTKTFSIKSGTYGNDGIQLQYSDEIDKPRFHVGNGSSNYLKFDGTTLDVKTDAFFVGNQNTQFISGSNNIIEISSSNFHLSSSGDVVVAGNITATTGEIGGFTISSDALSSDNFFISGAAENDELFISSSGFSVDAQGIVSASALSLIGGAVGGLHVAEGTVSVGDILKLKDSGQITGSNVLFNGGTIGGFELSSTQINSSNNNIVLQSNGSATISGSSIKLKSPDFFFGDTNNFISGSGEQLKIQSSGTTTLSGSGVNILTPQFLFGQKSTAFVSGSNGNIEISSSKFHLQADGDVVMNNITASNANVSGEITANTGTIGGFTIGDDLSSGAGTLKLKGGTGQITGSDVLFSGGTIGGFELASTQLNSTNDNLILKSSGQITGSDVLFDGGKIAAWNLSSQIISSIDENGGIKLDSYNKEITVRTGSHVDSTIVQFGRIGGTVGSPEFGMEGLDTSGNTLFKLGEAGNEIAGWTIDSDEIKNGTNIGLDSSNKRFTINSTTFGNTGIQLEYNSGTPRAHIGKSTGEGIKFDGTNVNISSSAFNLGNTDNFISGSSGNLRIFSTGNTTLSGSSVNIHTPKFFFGSPTQFISGSNGNIEISSSNFHLTKEGNITASNVNLSGKITANTGEIGGFDIGTNLESQAGTLKLKGVTGQITGSDVLFNGGKIGDFNLSTYLTSDRDKTAVTHTSAGVYLGTDGLALGTGNLILKSAGQITASDAQIQGKITAESGTIGGFTIGDDLSSGAGTLKLKGGSGQITGSDVLFDGGVIGGFELSSTKINSSNDNLILSSSGVISASQVLFTGGKVAGWTINGTTLVGANATLDGEGSALYKTDAGPGSDSSAGYDQLRDEYYIDFTPTEGATNSAGQFYVKFGPNFSIDNDGILYASGAKFEGTVSASKGIIGGFTTDNNSFSSTNLFISGSPAIGGVNHPKYMFISSSNWNVKQNGDMTGSQVLFTGGKIADFNIDSTEISDSDLDLRLKSSGQITGSNVLFDGGKIAGWTINGNALQGGTGGTIRLHGGNQKITINTHTFGNTGIQLDYNGGTPRAHIGRSGGQGIKFDGTSIVLSSSAFNLGNADNFISGSTGNLKIFSTGETTLSGSQVTIETPKFFFGSPSQFISGSNNNIEISSSNFHLDKDGSIDMSGTIRASAGAIAGFTISGNTLTATNFTLDATGKSITLGDTSTNNVFIVDADTGIQLGHNTFASAPFSVTKAGVLKATSGTVGGWTLGDSTIVGSNLTLRSSGIIETNDFASGVKGWRLSSEGNGEAEFENVTIRGTLSTAVFEKETVNAVGGQLYVANSTAITGSGQVSASNATMSVVNVGGFVQGEILSLKKVSDTGFSTEYVLVNSASRDDNTSTTNFAGKLFVDRGYGSGSAGESGSLGGTPAQSQSYEPGQVIVSTGKEGTGYIRLNANPSDDATPFIDIVERTGSGVYDVDLKARLGDLSGLSTARLQGTSPTSAGFGLYSQNVFLEGGIIANTGSIAGIKMQSGKLFIGTGTHANDNTGFFANSDGDFSLGSTFVWDASERSLNVSGSSVQFNTGQFLLGGGSQFVSGSSGNIEISSSMFHLDPKNNKVTISGSITATDGLIGGFEVTPSQINSTNDALILTSTGTITGSKFLLQGGRITSDVTIEGDLSANSIAVPSGGGSYKAQITSAGFANFVSASIGGFHIDDLSIRNPSSTLLISSSQSGTITMGPTPPLAFNNGNGFFADGGGQFLIGSASGHRIQFDGNDLIMSSSKYFLGDRGSSFISGSNGVVEISSSNFHLSRSGDVVISGDVTATTGTIGGFTIDSDEIKSGTNISMNSSNKALTINSATFGNTGIQFEYNSGTPRAFIGQTSGPHIKFDGTNVSLSSSAFNLGNADNYISGSTGNLKIFSTGETTLSGSQVTIHTPKFFFGSPSQFISGSSGNIEITSSMFHLDPVNNKVAISGSIVATDGTIGGFDIGANTISTTGASISDSTQGLFLSASKFQVDHDGNVTASNVDLSGKITATSGDIGGFTIDSGHLTADNFRLDSADATLSIGTGTDGFALDNRIVLDGNHTGSVIYQSDWASGVDSWTGDNTQAGNIDNVSDGSTTKNNVYRITVVAGTAPKNYRNVSLDVGQQYTVSFTYLIPDAGSTGGANGGVDGFRFAIDDSSDEGLGTYSSGVVGTWTTVSKIITAENATTQFRIYPTDGTSYTFGGGSAQIGDLVYISDFSVKAVRARFSVGRELQFEDNSLTVSGSSVKLHTPDFFLGDANNFVSGSTGNLKIFSTGDTTLSGSSVKLKTPDFFFGNSNMFISGSTGNVEISSSNFHLTTDGSVKMSGSIVAQEGSIGGFTIDSDEIKAGSTLILDSDTNNGEIKLGAASSLIAGNGIYMNGSGHFRAGKASGQGIKFDGTNVIISSSAFNLGNADNYISGSTGNLKIFSTGETTLSGSSVTIATPEFYFGSPSQYLSGSNGNLEISSSGFALDRAGNITASAGKISDWIIDGHKLKSVGGNIRLNGNGDNAEISINSHTFGNEGIQLGYNGGDPQLYAGDGSNNHLKYTTANGVDIKTTRFVLDTDKLDIDSGTNNGKIALGPTPPTSITTHEGFYADGNGNVLIGDADGPRISFDGTDFIMSSSKFFLGDTTTSYISGSTGNLKIFSTGNTTLSGSSIKLKTPDFFFGNSDMFISGSTGNVEISSSNFHLTTDGSVRMSGSIVAQEGSIGGWTLNATTIAGGDTTLTNDGTITLGGTANTGVGGTNAGIYMDATGDFLVYGDADNFLKFDVSDKLEIKADTFDLDAGTLVLDSGTNSGKIALGVRPPTAYNAGNGFYADGTGKVLIGNMTGSRFQYDGTDLIMSSSNFFLGSSENFISASNGVLEISSSKFHLSRSGDIVLQGDLTADRLIANTAGEIGGFNIGANDIWGGNAAIDNANTTIVLGNLDGTSKIALGATADDISMTAGEGVYLDGGGKVMIGDADGDRITYDGTNVVISSSAFFLGDRGGAGAYISGSGDKIEISSSNFMLKTDGSVTASGLLIMSGSGDVLLDRTGNLVGGRVSGEPVAALKASADLAKGALEASGSGFKIKSGISLDGNVLVGGLRASRLSNIDNDGKFQGDLGGSATLDGDAIADVKTGASRANAAIDSGGEVIANVTGNIAGTSSTTVKDRATKSLNRSTIFSEWDVAGESNGDTPSGFPEYMQTGGTDASSADGFVTKAIFLYQHDVNTRVFHVNFFQYIDDTNISESDANRPAVQIVFMDMGAYYQGQIDAGAPLTNNTKTASAPAYSGTGNENTIEYLTDADAVNGYKFHTFTHTDSAMTDNAMYSVFIRIRGGKKQNNSTDATLKIHGITVQTSGGS